MDACYPWLAQTEAKIAHLLATNNFPQALLLSGQSGLGKTDLALRLLQRQLCERAVGLSACGHCQSCQLFSAQTHPDCMVLHPEGKSDTIKVDAVRELILRTQSSPQISVRKVLMIVRAECMNKAACNALLKTLEEPTASTYLILVSDHPARLLPTLLSRCYHLKLPTPMDTIALNWLHTQGANSIREAALCLALAYGAPLKALTDYQAEKHRQFDAWHDAFLAFCTGKQRLLTFLKTTSVVDARMQLEFLHFSLVSHVCVGDHLGLAPLPITNLHALLHIQDCEQLLASVDLISGLNLPAALEALYLHLESHASS